MEIILKNKIQIFIFRSRNQQFVYWGQKEQKWCEKYKDYFTIIDDGEGQIEHNVFKVMKISDFKKPLYLDNKTIHEGVGLLNIANNIDQFDYQYIGFIHMDMFPLYLNKAYLDNDFKMGYPIVRCQLFEINDIETQLKDNTQFFFSFALINALSAFHWHLQDFGIIIDNENQTIWDFLVKHFNVFDVLKLNEQQVKELKLPFACSFMSKKSYWKKLQLFIDNLDQMQDIEKYGHKILECKCDKNIIVSQMLQAFVELTILDYITENREIDFRLIPICHFN